MVISQIVLFPILARLLSVPCGIFRIMRGNQDGWKEYRQQRQHLINLVLCKSDHCGRFVTHQKISLITSLLMLF